MDIQDVQDLKNPRLSVKSVVNLVLPLCVFCALLWLFIPNIWGTGKSPLRYFLIGAPGRLLCAL